VSIPPTVIKQLQAAAILLIARVPPGTVDGMLCKDLYPEVFRISEPDHRELFVAEISVGMGGDFFYLVAYDSRTGAATTDPPHIGAKSQQSFGAEDELVKKPFLSTADLFQNHHPQVVFEERVHNGTMYNGVVYHYFDIQPNLALIRVLARETRVRALDPHEGLFVRELTIMSPTRVRMDTFSETNGTRKAMGYVILESAGPGHAFRVAERHPADPNNHQGLVTFTDESPKGEEVFLREGYTFYY